MGDRIYHFLWRYNSRDQAIVSLILGLVVWLIVRHWYVWDIALICAWIALLGTYLIAQAMIIVKTNGLRTQQRVSQREPNSWITLSISIVVTLFSNIILGVLLTEVGHRNTIEARIVIALSVLAVVLSWLMLNLSFGKHYARFYYNHFDQWSKPLPEGEIRKGLAFPDTEQPNYLDFIYVANTIALTYAMSDVTATSEKVRQIILVQSLISFFFNSIVIGGVLNAIVTS